MIGNPIESCLDECVRKILVPRFLFFLFSRFRTYPISRGVLKSLKKDRKKAIDIQCCGVSVNAALTYNGVFATVETIVGSMHYFIAKLWGCEQTLI